MYEITFALIKPDAVMSAKAGQIIAEMETEFIVCDIAKWRWTSELLRRFYHEHLDRPWYPEFEEFMTSGPMYSIVLASANAVAKWREMIGATDPKKASPDSIRGRFGSKTGPIMHNAVHGSDSVERARTEIAIINAFLDDHPLDFGSIAKSESFG